VGRRRAYRRGLGHFRRSRRRPHDRLDLSDEDDPACRRSRAIAGLSEGGYGAINIALHHPGEFHVVESWSGYERAPRIPSIFGAAGQRLAANTPLARLPKVADVLRHAHVFFWFYSGADDPFHRQNREFSRELTRARVPHDYLEVPGGHNWAVWRGNVEPSLLAASTRLAHG